MKTISKFENAARYLPKSQAKVADYIVKNQALVAFMTIEQLAQNTGVSTATVMRLATSLGYSGYSDMMLSFKNSLIEEVTPFSRFISSSEGKNSNKFAEDFVKAEIEMLNATINYTSYDAVLDCVKLIGKSAHTYIVGYRISSIAATYMYQSLQRIMDNCRLMIPNSVDFLETLSRIGKEDVVIGCVFPRYYSQVPDVLKTAKERGAKTILITDSYNSPAAAHADNILLCGCYSVSFSASLLGAVYLIDYLINVFAEQNPETTKEQLNKTEEIFTEYRNKLY